VRVRRRGADAVTAAGGVALVALCGWAASSGTVGEFERRVFELVNDRPEAWRGPLWGFQLLGVLMTPLVVAAVALALRKWRLALALVLLVPIKLLVEKDVLKELVHRERPGTTVPGAVLRDVPTAGDSFPSGHAIIAFGIAVLLLHYLSRRWQVLVVVLAVLNSLARVYLGAHAPLDVVGGAAAGVAIAALLNLVVGVPARPTVRLPHASLRSPG
jgi:membrane-associated phospholipid phosphatase